MHFRDFFQDMLVQYLPEFGGIVDASVKLNDVRVIGCITMVAILGLAIVGIVIIIGCVLHLRRNTHWQKYASFDSLLSRAA